MSFEPWIGRTAGRNTFVVDEWIMGSTDHGRLLGHDCITGRRVHFGVIPDIQYPFDEIVKRLSYDIPGVARPRFFGGFDRFAPSRASVMVIEDVGDGQPLIGLQAKLSSDSCLRIAREVARTVQRATQQNVVLAGIHPDLIWVDEAAAEAVTLLPRFYVMVATRQRRRYTGTPPGSFSDIGPFLDPMMPNPWNATRAGDVYCVGLLLGWLFTGKHPFFESRDGAGWHSAMAEDQRDPFLGPPEIGAILDRVLLADPAQRMPIDDVVAALEAIR